MTFWALVALIGAGPVFCGAALLRPAQSALFETLAGALFVVGLLSLGFSLPCGRCS